MFNFSKNEIEANKNGRWGKNRNLEKYKAYLTPKLPKIVEHNENYVNKSDRDVVLSTRLIKELGDEEGGGKSPVFDFDFGSGNRVGGRNKEKKKSSSDFGLFAFNR